MTLPISVCLIVKNEADRLEKSLAPFVGRVGEIIAYIDSRTTDTTPDILQKLNITSVTGPWLGFSETRRAVWSMAKYDWILWLDADEIFSQETLKALEREFSKNPSAAGYRVRRQVVFQGQRIRFGDWGQDWVLRIFPRQGYQMDERLVHESVSVQGHVKNLPGIVEHHSFRSWADLEARSEHYATLWAQQAYAAGKRPGSPVLHATWKFIRGYFLKSGWLDGALGYKIALHNAREVYSKYAQLQNLCGKPPVERV